MYAQIKNHRYCLSSLIRHRIDRDLVLQPSYFVGSGNIEFGPHLQSATVNPAATAITVDIYFSVLVFSPWAFRESKRIGVKWPAAYAVLSFGVGLAFAFPLFLAFRERAIMRIERGCRLRNG